jgi:hypothetical protein
MTHTQIQDFELYKEPIHYLIPQYQYSSIDQLESAFVAKIEHNLIIFSWSFAIVVSNLKF